MTLCRDSNPLFHGLAESENWPTACSPCFQIIICVELVCGNWAQDERLSGQVSQEGFGF
ncbi:hypothetical protein [Candidatus Sororendozoicomonas aggregata]|uniref:hypothetical protein n=1 Tax=Candidatus Sororendozoicomonas aggregata TaxID=3073239 RepID=UPI002ED4CA4D